MTPIFNGRFTAQTDQPFVVFLIGMRINQWWRIDRWAPVARAMGPMMRRLAADDALGLDRGQFVFEAGLRRLRATRPSHTWPHGGASIR